MSQFHSRFIYDRLQFNSWTLIIENSITDLLEVRSVKCHLVERELLLLQTI